FPQPRCEAAFVSAPLVAGIRRAAILMLRRYRKEALEQSARRTEELAAAGDDDGAATWRRITRAVGQSPRPVHGSASSATIRSYRQKMGRPPFLRGSHSLRTCSSTGRPVEVLGLS